MQQFQIDVETFFEICRSWWIYANNKSYKSSHKYVHHKTRAGKKQVF